jgi:hypothetical protein
MCRGVISAVNKALTSHPLAQSSKPLNFVGTKGFESGYAIDHDSERRTNDTFVQQVSTTSLPLLKVRWPVDA